MIRISKSRKSTVREDDGFTVVEVLIAATIVVMGLLALATMFPTGYSTVTKSGIQSTGLALAQAKIESLRNQAYNTIVSGAPDLGCPLPPATGTTTESPITGYAGYTRVTNCQRDTPVAGAKQVTVTVTLPSAGTPTSPNIVLTTIVSE